MMKTKETYDNIASQDRRCLTHIIKELWTLQRVDETEIILGDDQWALIEEKTMDKKNEDQTR